MNTRANKPDILAARRLSLGALKVQFNWLIALGVVMTCGMFINLGLWQLDRAAEKRQMQREWEAAQSAEPIAFTALLQRSGNAVTNAMPVSLRGEYLNQQVAFLVLYQFFQGQPGYELISPVRVSGHDELVLVSRGWVAPGESGQLPLVPDVHGEQQLLARVHVPERAVEAGAVTDTQWPLRVPRLEPEQAGRLLGEAVYPYVLRLEADQSGVEARHWTQPSFSTRTHYGYAAQWFFFTLAVLLATLLLSTNLPALFQQWRGKKAV